MQPGEYGLATMRRVGAAAERCLRQAGRGYPDGLFAVEPWFYDEASASARAEALAKIAVARMRGDPHTTHTAVKCENAGLDVSTAQYDEILANLNDEAQSELFDSLTDS